MRRHVMTVNPDEWPLVYQCSKCDSTLECSNSSQRYEATQRRCTGWPGGAKRTTEMLHQEKAKARAEVHNNTADGYGHHLLEVQEDKYPLVYTCKRCKEEISGRPPDVYSSFCKEWKAPTTAARPLTEEQHRVQHHNAHAARLGRHVLAPLAGTRHYTCTKCRKTSSTWLNYVS